MPEMSELPETYNATLDDETRLKLTIERRKEQTQIRKGDYMMSKNKTNNRKGVRNLPIISTILVFEIDRIRAVPKKRIENQIGEK